MADPVRGSGPVPPGWGDVRQSVMRAAEICAAAVVSLRVRRGAHGEPARMAAEAVRALRDLDAHVRALTFAVASNEAVIEEEAAVRAGEILAAAGLVPPPRGRHLHVVS